MRTRHPYGRLAAKRRTVIFDRHRDIATNPDLGLIPQLEAMLDPNGSPCKGGQIRFAQEGKMAAVEQALGVNEKAFNSVIVRRALHTNERAFRRVFSGKVAPFPALCR